MCSVGILEVRGQGIGDGEGSVSSLLSRISACREKRDESGINGVLFCKVGPADAIEHL